MLKWWIGNYDGRQRGLVIAKTKKRALAIAGCRTARAFDSYWTKQDEAPPSDLEPDVLYVQPMDALGEERKVWKARKTSAYS